MTTASWASSLERRARPRDLAEVALRERRERAPCGACPKPPIHAPTRRWAARRRARPLPRRFLGLGGRQQRARPLGLRGARCWTSVALAPRRRCRRGRTPRGPRAPAADASAGRCRRPARRAGSRALSRPRTQAASAPSGRRRAARCTRPAGGPSLRAGPAGWPRAPWPPAPLALLGAQPGSA